ncbi:TetR/AcrR family transcriptional regulator [Sciscionella sediminilitoris]|uniref:TetR/AcrR family transcriptional regulator n=1 Tax=Sciscionella sediminilitoris TaxID=1445613 RepID=UPI0004DF72C5|nr:TetR/AcrR family transcriptional regulator [Sciscionella sp. SE31]
MPKRVDHEQRRRQIAEAVWRIAADIGLEGVTMRRVATEAEVSTRLVQYYFGTRKDLLLGALHCLNDDSRQRIEQRIAEEVAELADGAADGEAAEVRAVLRHVLVSMLPSDEATRRASLVHIAYFVHALSDPELAEALRAQQEPTLEAIFTELLGHAEANGRLRQGLDLAREADTLLALPGLGPDILLGLRTTEQIVELIDYHLDRLFR